MASAGIYPLAIEQGALFYRTFIYQDNTGTVIPLTGYTAAMKIRKGVPYKTHTQSVWARGIVILDCVSYLTIDEPNGKVTLSIPATITAGLAQTKEAVYDMELTPPGGATQTIRFLQGTVTINPEQTV